MSIATKVQASLTRSSWIRKMFEEGEKLRQIYGADQVYDFTLGNPDLEPPTTFKELLKEYATNPVPGMHKYMSNAGYPETRRQIANYLNQKSGLPFSENQIVMTVGAGGGLNVIFKTLLDPGDEVIVSAPYFVEYSFYVDNHQGKLVVTQTKVDFQLDPEAIAAAITPRTKAILINSPNNPTGAVYTQETLQKLAAVIQAKETEYQKVIYLISDEPYSGLVYDGITVPSIFKIFPHSILATSHSKDLALPGERIGYLAVSPLLPDATLIFDGLVFANRTLGFVNAPALMQRLIGSLQGTTVGVEIYQERRDLLYIHLTKLGFKLIKPQGAFYLFPKSPIADEIAFCQAAQKYNLLLVPGSGFGASGYFRIAYCVSRETILNSFEAFRKLAEEFNLHISN